jgi:hypothetical protein
MEDLPYKIIAILDIVCIVVLCRQKQDRDRQNMDSVNVLNRTHKAETKHNLLFYSAFLTVALKLQNFNKKQQVVSGIYIFVK